MDYRSYLGKRTLLPEAMLTVGIVALLITLEVLLPLAPRWPNGIGVTIVTAFLTPILALGVASITRKLMRRRSFSMPQLLCVALLATIVTFGLITVYMFHDSSLCWTVPPTTADASTGRSYRNRIIGGSSADVTNDAKQLVEQGLTIQDLLRENGFSPVGIWDAETTSRSERTLLGFWGAACLTGTVAAGLVVAFRSTRSATRLTATDEVDLETLPSQTGRVLQLLLQTYNREELTKLLRIDLSSALGEAVRFEEITSNSTFRHQVYEVVVWAEQNGHLPALIRVAATNRPSRKDWQTLVGENRTSLSSEESRD